MSSPATRPDQVYPSDLGRQQFDVIPSVSGERPQEDSPHKIDRLHVFNAVLYVLREGCRWRSLPKDYPDWNLCYYHYRVWRDHIDEQTALPLLELVLKKIGVRRPGVCWKGRANHLSDH
jgi:transposase